MIKWLLGLFSLLFFTRCTIVPKGTAITPCGMLVWSPFDSMLTPDVLEKMESILVARLAQYLDRSPEEICRALDGVTVNVVDFKLKWENGEPIGGFYDPNQRVISVIGNKWYKTAIGHEAIHAIHHFYGELTPCVKSDMASCHANWTPRMWQCGSNIQVLMQEKGV